MNLKERKSARIGRSAAERLKMYSVAKHFFDGQEALFSAGIAVNRLEIQLTRKSKFLIKGFNLGKLIGSFRGIR